MKISEDKIFFLIIVIITYLNNRKNLRFGMKILAINCCLNGSSEEMSMIMEPFVSGLKEGGADVEVVNADKMFIQPCRACTGDSGYETDGKCKCDDDMQSLYPKFRESDIWVFASPVNDSSLAQDMINILDRMEPMFQPQIPQQDYVKKIKKNGKIAFLSTTVNYDKRSFTGAVNHFRAISKVFEREFAGAVLRPHAWAIKALNKIGVSSNDVFDAAKEAGKQLAVNGKIPSRIQKVVSRDLVPKKSFTNNLRKALV